VQAANMIVIVSFYEMGGAKLAAILASFAPISLSTLLRKRSFFAMVLRASFMSPFFIATAIWLTGYFYY